MEIWKPVPGYPGYEASNLGRIRSLDRTVLVYSHKGKPGLYYRTYKGKILKQVFSNPYKAVYVRGFGPMRIHQAVLLAFKGPRPNGMVACHNNGNSLDNRIENLRYDTERGNNLDRELHGTDNKGERHGLHKLCKDEVRTIKKSKDSPKELAKRFNVTDGCIRHILAGRRWSHADH